VKPTKQGQMQENNGPSTPAEMEREGSSSEPDIRGMPNLKEESMTMPSATGRSPDFSHVVEEEQDRGGRAD
jgi:hypothetical protein